MNMNETNVSQSNEFVKQALDQVKGKIGDAKLQSAASSRAASDPFPGPMAMVVDGGFVDVMTSRGKITFRPLVASDLVVLRKLNSPVYRELLEMGTPEEARTKVEYTDEDVFDIVYQFTNPIKEIRQLVKKGNDIYHETAMSEVGDKFNVADTAPLIAGFQTIVLGSTATMVEHEIPVATELDDKGNKVPISQEKRPDFFVNGTDSAGASSTSAV